MSRAAYPSCLLIVRGSFINTCGVLKRTIKQLARFSVLFAVRYDVHKAIRGTCQRSSTSTATIIYFSCALALCLDQAKWTASGQSQSLHWPHRTYRPHRPRRRSGHSQRTGHRHSLCRVRVRVSVVYRRQCTSTRCPSVQRQIASSAPYSTRHTPVCFCALPLIRDKLYFTGGRVPGFRLPTGSLPSVPRGHRHRFRAVPVSHMFFQKRKGPAVFERPAQRAQRLAHSRAGRWHL